MTLRLVFEAASGFVEDVGHKMDFKVFRCYLLIGLARDREIFKGFSPCPEGISARTRLSNLGGATI